PLQRIPPGPFPPLLLTRTAAPGFFFSGRPRRWPGELPPHPPWAAGSSCVRRLQQKRLENSFVGNIRRASSSFHQKMGSPEIFHIREIDLSCPSLRRGEG